MSGVKIPFMVTVDLPLQEILVYARDPEEAEWIAWHMIGKAGVAYYGNLHAAPIEREELQAARERST